MDRNSVVHRLFGVVLFIGCCSYQLAAGLPNLYSVYANKKGGGSEEKPILAMANSPRCLYNGKPVENGYKVPNTEPCLNCTCNDGVLLCYLQTCPTLVVPSKDCHVGRAEGNCCPQVRCKNANFPYHYLMWNNKPHLPYYKYAADELGEKPAANDSKDSDNTDHLFVGSNHNAQYSDQFYNRFRRTSKTPQLTTLSSDSSTTAKRRPQPQIQVLHHQETNFASGVPSEFDGVQNETFGDCYSKGFKYSEGMAMLSSSKCEYCYCIGGQQMCVRPKCHLNIGGCTAKYQSGFTCCPSHYECEVPADGNDNNFASIENTIRVPAEVKVSSCKVDGQEYKVGVAVASKGHCQTCYCTQVGIVCRRIECSPVVDGCEAIIPDGHCCPTEYECDDAASNRTKIPVSHSTDNYDVMVIAPSDSFTTEEDYVPEADEEINNSKYESSGSTTPKDRITIEVDQDSTVHSVSIIPEDKLAVLVLTTEKDSEEKLHAISMENKNQDTTITGTTTSQSGFEPSSPYATDRVSSTESTDTDTSTSYGRQTDLTPPETNDRHSTMTTAQQQDQTYTSDKDLHSTIGSATIAVDGDYYYDEYYPSDDYYPVEKEPNEVEVAARETFSPFSDYGTSDSHKKISTTLEHQEITNPRIVESTTTVFQNEQTPSTHKETNPSYDYVTKDYSKSNTGTLSYDESSNPGTDKDHVYAKFGSTSTIKEDHLSSTYQTYTSFASGNQPSETTYKSETQNILEVDPTISTPKRTTYTALSTQTIPSTVTEVNTGDSTYIQENKEQLTSESKERTQGEEEGDINTYLSTNADEGHWTVTTGQTENSVYPQKTSTSTIPIEVAELILAITKSQSEKTDVTQPENTAYTETEPTTRDNTQPSIKVNEEFSQSLALAAPKLIIERTTTKEDGVPEMTPPVPLTTDANLFKYKSPLVIFSNHGPSAPIRPLSSVQTGIPAEVNNHKVVSNPSTFRQKPQRPTAATNQTPSTTAIEFSNHRPTNTLRRPPMNKGQPRPGIVVKIGVQKPSIVRPSDGSHKTHRIVSESDDRDNNSSELQKGVDKENKLLKENDFKSLETHHLLEKPVSVSLTVDDHGNDHSVKPQLDEGHSHIPMESVSTIFNIVPFTDGANKEHHQESTLLSPGEEEESQQNSEIPKDIYEDKEVTKFIANAETTSSYVHQSTPKSKTEYQSSEDGKLSRADDELHVEDLDSPFVDRRLTSYGVGPLQRVPETKLKPHDFSTPEKLHNTEEETVQEIADVCFVDGRYYKSGEIIVKSNPCELCRCFYGYPLCQLQQCPDPPNPACMLEYLPGYCCPRVTCGVRDDVKNEARPPIGPTQEQIPQTASDNQWRPLPNAYPQGTHNSKRGEEATGVNAIRNKDESNSSELLKTHVPPPSNVKEIATSHVIKVSEISDPLREVGMKEQITTLSSLAIPSPTEPNPVFNPKQKKDNSSSIHDNSSGVRKILDDSVVLPASKVSLSPVNSSDIKTVLPLIHAAPTSVPDVRPISVSPTVIANDDAKSGISSEFGGNLKISGCNVYGEYYKINDKVSVLSKPCSECVCSADGISCTETC